ncbi:MAG: hypothetical protein VB092_05365 [Oscillospiraceae bacterium]|nr:hypothetical protein [Oscillospiraceae bacterium]
MSKYDPIWAVVAQRTEDSLTLTFAEIEAVLGFPVDHSLLTYKKELSAWGCAVDGISMKAQTVTFRRLPAPVEGPGAREQLLARLTDKDAGAACAYAAAAAV